ncbi:hypothetical protein AB6A40_003062 [Gnathostoma spinigerum]|uniref:Lysozyme n=1 Tax=Gnathostoma spinigerum TaxID=75299 RepID=A0ABD6E8J4_9BILA
MVRLALFSLGCFATFSLVTFAEEITVQPAVTPSKYYSHAFDVMGPVSLETFECFRKTGYNTTFIRAYKRDKLTGSTDPDLVSNIRNAHAAKLGVETYIVPQPESLLSGEKVVDEITDVLSTNGITLLRVWIKVTSPNCWPNNHVKNRNLITDMARKAKASSIWVGIYTNWYDWEQIMGDWEMKDAQLWYWKMNGKGMNSSSKANFDDFFSFGGFDWPLGKTYAGDVKVCGINADVGIYPKVVEKPKNMSDNDKLEQFSSAIVEMLDESEERASTDTEN